MVSYNGSRIGEVAENRSWKFRFRRHVANAFLSMAKLQKKANAKSIGGIRRRNVQLTENPAILPMRCYRKFYFVLKFTGYSSLTKRKPSFDIKLLFVITNSYSLFGFKSINRTNVLSLFSYPLTFVIGKYSFPFSE